MAGMAEIFRRSLENREKKAVIAVKRETATQKLEAKPAV